MRAILHIGVEKTGTTSIQQFLALNREALKSRSILFPKSPGYSNHMHLAGHAANDAKRDDIRMRELIVSQEDLDRFRAKVVANLEAEVRAAGCETVILSGEHCSSRLLTLEEVQRLHDVLSGLFESVRVIVYLRRQDEFLLSSYSTMVKCGHTAPLVTPPPDEIRDRYDFAKLLDLWSGVFGREAIEARLYGKTDLAGGSAVLDFAQAVGLPDDIDYALPGDENPSLDVATLELLRLMNEHIPYIADGKIFPRRGNLHKLLEKVSSGPGVMMDADELAAFMRSFAEGNREVARAYFGGERFQTGDPLFGPAPSFAGRKIAEPIGLEKAVELFAELWKLKQQQVDQLTYQNNQLRAKK